MWLFFLVILWIPQLQHFKSSHFCLSGQCPWQIKTSETAFVIHFISYDGCEKNEKCDGVMKNLLFFCPLLSSKVFYQVFPFSSLYIRTFRKSQLWVCHVAFNFILNTDVAELSLSFYCLFIFVICDTSMKRNRFNYNHIGGR